VIVDCAGGGISRIDAGCEALAGGGVFPRDVRAPRPESSAAHLADWNDLTKVLVSCRF
jgi:hypothetical protein